MPQLRSVRVHVVDRDTRAEIGDVTVIRSGSYGGALEHAASPVSITGGAAPESRRPARELLVHGARLRPRLHEHRLPRRAGPDGRTLRVRRAARHDPRRAAEDDAASA